MEEKMDLIHINIEQLRIQPYALFENQWLLLTSGDFQQNHFNAMTIGWGSIGCMWGKPFIQVVVRPIRHTYKFLETYETFTVCALPPEYRDALQLLGSTSGRDLDKIAQSGLIPMASQVVTAPAYRQAELVIECRKSYWQDMDPAHFLNQAIHASYPAQDYHRIYFGEILSVQANARYIAA